MSEFLCPGCGKQLTEHTRFCPECGARLPEQPAALSPNRPSGGSPTVVLPPAERAEPAFSSSGPTDQSAGASAPIPPTQRLDLPAPPPLAAAPADEAGPPASKSRRTLWWILGGVGCLSVLLVGACLSIGTFVFLGQRSIGGPAPVATAIEGVGGIVPDISPLTGADVVFEDDFSTPGISNLDVSEDETSRSAYEDGVYLLEVKVPETVVWSLVDGRFSAMQVEVDTEVPGDSEVAAAGLVFHYQDGDNFYLYSVSNDGYYALEALQGGEWTVLIDPTLSDAIDSTRNRLRVEAGDGRIAIYANGVLLEETRDDTFTSGEVGLAASTFQDTTGIVRFDNLVIARGE